MMADEGSGDRLPNSREKLRPETRRSPHGRRVAESRNYTTMLQEKVRETCQKFTKLQSPEHYVVREFAIITHPPKYFGDTQHKFEKSLSLFNLATLW